MLTKVFNDFEKLQTGNQISGCSTSTTVMPAPHFAHHPNYLGRKSIRVISNLCSWTYPTTTYQKSDPGIPQATTPQSPRLSFASFYRSAWSASSRGCRKPERIRPRGDRELAQWGYPRGSSFRNPRQPLPGRVVSPQTGQPPWRRPRRSVGFWH